MFRPSANYTLASVDNNRSEYIDTSAPLGTTKKSYTAVSDSGKGNSAARRVLGGVDVSVPGSAVPLSVRVTIVVPTGGTAQVTDSELEALANLLSVMLNGAPGHIYSNEFINSVKGVLTQGDASGA